jgi:hypothetical protein
MTVGRLISIAITNLGLIFSVRGRTFPDIRPSSGKRGTMSVPEAIYVWQQPYLAAVCETDNGLMMIRIYEALAAIEQRRLTPVEPDGDEDRALVAAEVGLKALIAERIGDVNG